MRRLVRRPRRFLGDRGPAEVGVQHDARGVDDAPQTRPILAPQLLEHLTRHRRGLDLAVQCITLPNPAAQVVEDLANGLDDEFPCVFGALQGRTRQDFIDRRQGAKRIISHAGWLKIPSNSESIYSQIAEPNAIYRFRIEPRGASFSTHQDQGIFVRVCRVSL